MRKIIISSIVEFKIKLRKLGYWIFILLLYFLHYSDILSAKINPDAPLNLNYVIYSLLNETTNLAFILSIGGILFISNLVIKDEMIKIEDIIKSSGIKTFDLILGKLIGGILILTIPFLFIPFIDCLLLLLKYKIFINPFSYFIQFLFIWLPLSFFIVSLSFFIVMLFRNIKYFYLFYIFYFLLSLIIIPIIKFKILGNMHIYFYDSFLLQVIILKSIYERFTVPIEYLNSYPSLTECYLSILGNLIFGIILILLTNYLKIRYEENA